MTIYKCFRIFVNNSPNNWEDLAKKGCLTQNCLMKNKTAFSSYICVFWSAIMQVKFYAMRVTVVLIMYLHIYSYFSDTWCFSQNIPVLLGKHTQLHQYLQQFKNFLSSNWSSCLIVLRRFAHFQSPLPLFIQTVSVLCIKTDCPNISWKLQL